MILDLSAPGNVLRLAVELLDRGIEAAPALMLGLSALIVVPLLVGIGAIVIKRSRRVSQRRPESGDGPTRAWRGAPPAALLSLDDRTAARLAADNPLVRIGRQEDNDIRIESDSVHRYHAIVHRGDDGRYWLLDLSGPDGNGVRVNGAPAARQRLDGGETIEVGTARLKFSLARHGSEVRIGMPA